MTDSTEQPDPAGTAAEQPPTEVPNETNEQIREQRLDPENRPESTEVNNTQRTFDPAAGRFTDDPEYSEEDKPYDPADDA